MLNNSLYFIKDLEDSAGTVSAKITLNAMHPIFKGHYPNQPVLPGACMLQLIKEVFQGVLNKNLILSRAPQLKFLAMVDPHCINELQLQLTYQLIANNFKVAATLSGGKQINFKFQGNYQVY